MQTTLKIETPVLELVLSNGPFYDFDWQPNRRYWTGRVVTVPEPYQAGDSEPFDHHMRGHNRTMVFNASPTAESGC